MRNAAKIILHIFCRTYPNPFQKGIKGCKFIFSAFLNSTQSMPLKFIYLLSFTCLLLTFSCVQNKTAKESIPSKPTVEKRTVPFDIPLDDLRQYASDTTITFQHDKAFAEPVTFRGFSFNKVIEALALEETDRLQATIICTDGYKPSMPLLKIAEYEGYITYQQSKEELAIWADSIRERIPPYYLTWNTPQLEKDLMNPYGATTLRIEYIGYNYDKILPPMVKEDSLLTAGFHLYEKMCMKCHSINKEGGDLGPELNIPQNITEYRDKEFIHAFIKNPQTFRYNSKMHPIPLSDEKLDLIYNYLVAMKDAKVPVLEEE